MVLLQKPNEIFLGVKLLRPSTGLKFELPRKESYD